MEFLFVIVVTICVYAIGYYHGEKDTKLDLMDKAE